jgi:hypothetical protein
MWKRLLAWPVARGFATGAQARGLAVVAVFLLAASPVSAAVFVGSGLTDLKAEEKVTVAQPKPVQLLFEFRTKGAPNLQGAKQLKPDVIATVKASGLFSEVSEGSTENGAILNIVIDDVVTPDEMKEATTKGAVTGATLFIAGTNIREHYTCVIDYMPNPAAQKITRKAEHSIVMQMGLINSVPTDAVKVDGGIKGAVAVMTRQIVANPLNAIGADPAFAPTVLVDPAAAAPAALPAPEPTPAPAAGSPTGPAPAEAPKPPTEAVRS